jgi:uncharacterized protein YegP (UPF0339 family)
VEFFHYVPGGEDVGVDEVVDAAGEVGRRAIYMAEEASNGRYVWRLTAPNGRTVAVSSPQYRTLEDAWRAFASLRGDVSGQLARITHVRQGVGWVWFIPGPQGQPLARSARAYERYASCQNAFRRFIALLASQIDTSAPRLQVPGPHPSRDTARDQ